MDDKTPPWPTLTHPKLSDDARRQLLEEMLATASDPNDIWIFGFGSLMWNPGFTPRESREAQLAGYERRFHIWSTKARGTPERPGLGLCLEPADGTCRGIAYRIKPETRDQDLAYLWDREMGSGVYRPTWVELEATDGKPIRAITWVADPEHYQYAGARPAEEMAMIMAGGKGVYGNCRDYLANTIREMKKLGDNDPLLDQVLTLIDARED